jgi:hypothetical protein
MAWRRRAPHPELVREGDAQGRTREIYSELKQALGVPHINLVYQLLGGHPKFLELHWQAMRPAVDSAEFFDFAERVRADAYTRLHNYFAVPDLCAQIGELSSGAREEVTEVVEVFQYTDALLLLILTAQLQAFDAPVGSPRPHETSPAHPRFREKPVVVNESSATPEQRKIFDDIRRTLSLGILNTEFRALARFPLFFSAYWAALKPAVQSPLYESMVLGIRESAWNLARDQPVTLAWTIRRSPRSCVSPTSWRDPWRAWCLTSPWPRSDWRGATDEPHNRGLPSTVTSPPVRPNALQPLLPSFARMRPKLA